jgi:hypothetical protein
MTGTGGGEARDASRSVHDQYLCNNAWWAEQSTGRKDQLDLLTSDVLLPLMRNDPDLQVSKWHVPNAWARTAS